MKQGVKEEDGQRWHGWIERKKNHLRNKVCCNPAAILWQFPHPFVVFWYEFFRRAGERLRYEGYGWQDDNCSDRRQIKVVLALESIKWRGPRPDYTCCSFSGTLVSFRWLFILPHPMYTHTKISISRNNTNNLWIIFPLHSTCLNSVFDISSISLMWCLAPTLKNVMSAPSHQKLMQQDSCVLYCRQTSSQFILKHFISEKNVL